MCLLLTPLELPFCLDVLQTQSHTRTESFLFGPLTASCKASRQYQTDHHLYDHWCKTRCKRTPILSLHARPRYLTLLIQVLPFLFTSCSHLLLSDDFATSMNTAATIRQSYGFPHHLVLVSSFCANNLFPLYSSCASRTRMHGFAFYTDIPTRRPRP